MSFWTYMLRCSDGSYHSGHTDALERRIAQHQAGEIPGYTHDGRPVELVFAQAFTTREEALAAERPIKGWTRARKEALIQGDWKALREAAIPPHERAVRALRPRSGRAERWTTT